MRSLFIALGLVVATVPAVAAPDASAPKRGNENLRTYCSGDAVTFCSGKDPDSPEMDACFERNMGQLSENCRRAIKAYKAGGGR
ncbi:hypothetical protein AU375_04786 [Methylobacterium radiotolerans]|nr:hypothetical protein AU375_04786 [Methylobacterium radiotolerans]